MKPTARMTGKDYHNSYDELKRNEKSLEAHITERLIELGTIHPDAIICKIADTEIKATCLTRQWVESLKVPERIEIIETIEKWSSDKQNIRQLEI